MSEPDAAELAAIFKHEGAFFLKQHEMIVLGGLEIGFFDPHVAGHPEVEAQPEILCKAEHHLFAAGLRAEQRGARKKLLHQTDIRASEDSFLRVKQHSQDLFPQSGIPTFAEIFDFGQLRHGGR